VEVERRTAAVLSADGKGYSRLMSEDETGTVRMLTAYRDVMRDTVAQRHGRVVDTAGDNLLAEFGNVIDAVGAAVEIQRLLAARNADVPESRRLEFRIGVNLGEVLVADDRIYGDTVNVAASLEALADAGGLCVSSLVHDQVSGKLELEWDSLGDVAVKNIAHRVGTYRLRQARSVDASVPAPFTVSTPHRPSIAVLPFRETTAATPRYFGDGIAEDVVVALASLPDLFVVSQGSTARFREWPADVGSVGRELDVRYVLSGSVGRIGDRLSITAELVDSETQTVIWTDRIAGAVDDLFDLHDRVSQKTITTIVPHVRNAETRRTFRKRPESLDAYDLTLRGLDLLYHTLNRREFERAREMFAGAITRDPRYATPYALTALWYSICLEQGWSVDRGADRAAVTRFAEAALERDPYDPRALALCGHLRALQLRDYEGALALFDRAVAASPNSSIAWVRSSPTYSYLGDGEEAMRRGRLGLNLSPLDPHIFYTHGILGLACYTSGQFRDAAIWGRMSMAANPGFTANLRILAASLGAAGELDEGRAVGAQLLMTDPAFRITPFCDGYAFRDPHRRTLLADHLRAVGLPE
jgi:adenylate cyclase